MLEGRFRLVNRDTSSDAVVCRTSGGTTDSVAFGLTEEQRLAKEEEEMNVALVEIQLRDEHSFPALGVRVTPVLYKHLHCVCSSHSFLLRFRLRCRAMEGRGREPRRSGPRDTGW